MKSKKWKIILIVLAIIIMVSIAIAVTPFVLSLKDEVNQEKFRSFIDSLGIYGPIVVVLIQILQIIVAVIPGEPIEILIGIMYGTWWGLFLCLLGVAIGSTLIFVLVRKFGKKFVDRFVNSEKFENIKFLKDPTRRDSLIFLMFFIPGTPKDILTYFSPFTGIKLHKFLIISTIARIPSIVTSTLLGNKISQGNFATAIIIFLITGIIGILGIILNNKFIEKKNKEKSA
ncbi:MAG: VTT domain-containing protein [Bacilli bacterium]|nr:VTT domain-containing protein [Bacilli bacterium]